MGREIRLITLKNCIQTVIGLYTDMSVIWLKRSGGSRGCDTGGVSGCISEMAGGAQTSESERFLLLTAKIN